MKRATEVVGRCAHRGVKQQLLQAESELAEAGTNLDERARKHEEEVAAKRRKLANAERAWEAERA
ncbi:coiled-coil domain containing [Pseudoscourfieldia marina]